MKFHIFLIVLLMTNLYGCIFVPIHDEVREVSQPPKVETYEIKPITKNSVTPYIGIAEAKNRASLHFLVAGKVTQCYIKEGAKVKANQKLCSLDTTAVDLELNRTKQSVESAKAALDSNLVEKQKALFESGVIGQAEYEQVRLQHEVAKANLNDAQTLYEMASKKKQEHELISPWEGTVVKLFAKPGNPISPDIPAMVIMDSGLIRIKTEIHASYFEKVQKGTLTEILQVSSELLDPPARWVVTEKSTHIEPTHQTFEIVMGPTESPVLKSLVPGIMVLGKIEMKSETPKLLLPIECFKEWEKDKGGTIYSVGPDNRLQAIKVKTGALVDSWIELKEKQYSGMKVVRQVRPGMEEGDLISPLLSSPEPESSRDRY